MATFNTTLYAAQDEDRANTSVLPNPNQAGGGVHMAVVPYALTPEDEGEEGAAEAANDKINLCVLPAGAIPIPGLSFVECEVPVLEAGALTVHVGYASNADALAQGIELTAGGHVSFMEGAMPADGLTPKALASGDTTLVATVASATNPKANAKLVFHIAYKVPA